MYKRQVPEAIVRRVCHRLCRMVIWNSEPSGRRSTRPASLLITPASRKVLTRQDSKAV